MEPCAVSTTTAMLELSPRLLGQLGQQADAVHARHLQVRHHDGRIPGQRLLPALDAVARGLGPVSPAGDQLRQPHQRVGLVFDNQDLYGVLHIFFQSKYSAMPVGEGQAFTATYLSRSHCLGLACLFSQFRPSRIEGVVLVLRRSSSASASCSAAALVAIAGCSTRSRAAASRASDSSTRCSMAANSRASR